MMARTFMLAVAVLLLTACGLSTLINPAEPVPPTPGWPVPTPTVQSGAVQEQGDAEDLLAKGIVYYTAGDFASALEALNAAIALDPLAPLPYYYRGLTYEAMNERQAADADLQHFLSLNPADPELADDARSRLSQ